jgi:hypothetical protein
MGKRIKSIYEFMMAEPKTAPTRTTPAPTTTPSRPAPGPIRRDKPSTQPRPAATAKELVDEFVSILRDGEAPKNFDIKKFRSRYGKRA